ncbi:serine/threonine-protein kinase [Streptomyces sp. NBC_00083]|uniref:serine/threonine-protein kinase n=1 Tax=Streptomyces sp. NBC_00083 TaxID=2975647 RepID=UPI002259C6DD|nr:serine/threonine-protein kinase [Streptomyces sp. NBC_00083]MCX5388078.1 protein kinase [Streptomyces sp. NBC_00083]
MSTAPGSTQRLEPGDPERIGTYRLLARLGAGGMGQVYLARSDRNRTVAVKLVRPDLADQDEFRARFRQEVRAALRVGGAWTAPVLDADTEAPAPWIATGYIAGPSLQAVVKGPHGPLPDHSVRVLARGLTLALKDIHGAGIVHRDLKPSNVLITIDGPRVIDFGIARALESGADGTLTRAGALVGSPGFMAPEQVRGDRITPACDVFCLGSVLAYAASGRLPFGEASSGPHAQMFRIAQEPPSLDGVPDSLQDLIRDCLHKDPAARPGLDQILSRLPGHATDPWLPAPLVAQLGSHAAQLLDMEDPGATTTTARTGTTSTRVAPPGAPQPAETPHPPAAHADIPAPPHTSTFVPRSAPPAPLPTDQAAYDYPPSLSTPYAPEPPPSRSTKSTVALIAVALVVAVGAGGSVYAFMSGDSLNGGSDDKRPTASSTGTPNSPSPSGSPSKDTSPFTPGSVPHQYIGAWTATVPTATGEDPRDLVIRAGSTGDTILTLTAQGSGYHCVFQARLTSSPTTRNSQLQIGPSTVAPGSTGACNPGKPSTISLLPDGRLHRLTAETGEFLDYEKD